jgi:LPS-assembly protein
MRMKMDDSTGFFEQPEYSIRRIKTGSAATLWTGTEERVSSDLTTGRGAATRMEFEGEGKYRLTDATYSTCAPVPDAIPTGSPAPPICASTTMMKRNRARRHAVFQGHAHPLFALDELLAQQRAQERPADPDLRLHQRGGIEFTQPFYWNIAQNMDATIAPRFMAKRGMLWNGEYRYLQPNYSGTMQGQYLPEDKLEHDSADRPIR